MSDTDRPLPVARFYWVDALRGVAALAIVILHYHHFYLADADDRPSLPDIASFPFASFLAPLYSPFAANAVELFWLISGFVFVHVYLHRQTGAWPFAVARFARLYPLHFATLVYVALLQFISIEAVGHWQVYGNNDARHFVLHLFMASNWTSLSRGLSFNGPIWSVSLEIVVYAMFFVALHFIRKAPLLASLCLCAASWTWVAWHPVDLPLIRLGVFECAGYFFLGAVLYCARPHGHFGRALAIGSVGGALSIAGFRVGVDHLLVAGLAVALLAVAAGLDSVATQSGKRLSALGDISYSLYLVHVPLQMTVLLFADVFFDGSRQFAESYLTLPVYVTASVLLAYAIFHWYERPLGRMSKRALLGRKKQFSP
ncbi:acyltransferase [Cognatiyoonia sp. IB215182]|uniref:acyltransferase family protein n=1 Tax=Cognatiyoonia sp. IB215182 TaxID=3097353 RepID=UPI002A17F757|nr:acyltransferase [Cognatiyoonia sp. IB215182]MDX8354557.1 acyltransferase [Cognatiyoonia sp. IB215182]